MIHKSIIYMWVLTRYEMLVMLQPVLCGPGSDSEQMEVFAYSMFTQENKLNDVPFNATNYICFDNNTIHGLILPTDVWCLFLLLSNGTKSSTKK